MQLDMDAANSQLKDKHPQEIVNWATELDGKAIVTTNFGPNAAVLLHLCVQARPDIPVMWVDSGYGTRKTYLFAERLIADLDLNIHVYNPLQSAARRDAIMGIPDVDDPMHETFTEQVKLEPFRRALHEMKPDVWLTGIRREQTEFRKKLDIVTQDAPGGVFKVAPVFYWSEFELHAYMEEHGLPNETSYYDPTKVLGNRECGLHNRLTA